MSNEKINSSDGKRENKVVTKIEQLRNQLRKIENELAELNKFRPSFSLQQFKRQLYGERTFVKRQLFRLKPTQGTKEKDKENRLSNAQRNRSEKMKRNWRYIKSIQQNYHPEKSLREIRSAFSKQKRGYETDISGLVWRNPSP
jgi:hypothetical protein